MRLRHMQKQRPGIPIANIGNGKRRAFHAMTDMMEPASYSVNESVNVVIPRRQMLDLLFMDAVQQLATLFRQYEAFQWNPDNGFVLASGETSPYYVDCRALLAHPDARWLVAQLACEAIRDLSLEAVGGLEIGAIPLATAISDYAFATQPPNTYDTFVIRKQAKDHGLGKRIEGAIKANARTLIVDDVLTSGGSLLQALQAARDAQLHVSHALIIVDRQEQEGKQKIEAQGVSLISLLTLDELKAA